MSNKLRNFAEALAVAMPIHGPDYFGLQVFKRKSGTNEAWPVEQVYVTHDQLPEKLSLLSRQGLEAFMMTGVTNDAGFKNDDVIGTWALALDFDHGVPDILKTNPLLTPSIIIETSPGRYHVVWVLDAMLPVERIPMQLRGMAQVLGADMAHAKASQMIRVVGTVNGKTGHVVRLCKASNLEKTFSADFLWDAFDLDLVTKSVQRCYPRMTSSFDIKTVDHDPHVIEDLYSALEHIKHLADDYGEWVNIVMACAPLGEEGRKLAQKFSKFSSKYDEREFEKKWKSLQNSPGYVGTLFLAAQAAGWKNPGYRHDHTSNLQVLTDREFGRMIAQKMGQDFAVINTGDDTKQKLTMLSWRDGAYRSLDAIGTRQAVAACGEEILLDLQSGQKLDSTSVIKFKHKLGTNRSLNEVVEHVAEAMLPHSQQATLRHYPYMGVRNGVLNLLRQELVSEQFHPLSAMMAPVEYDPKAGAPLFRQTIHEIFNGNQSLLDYVQKLLGYMILGKPKEQIFPIFYGPTAGNGKNTLVDTLHAVIGPYWATLPTNAVMTKSHVAESTTPALARMEGRRIAVVSETNDKHPLDSAFIKSMTGDKVINVRDNYASNKDMLIEFVLLMLTNYPPKVRDDDHGFWRRAVVVPFNQKFFGPNEKKGLRDELAKEASGILNYLLEGVRAYLQQGLVAPECVIEATSMIRNDLDPVTSFIADKLCAVEGSKIPLKALFDDLYQPWAKANPQFPPLSRKSLSQRLQDKGFHKITRSNNAIIVGLAPQTLTA